MQLDIKKKLFFFSPYLSPVFKFEYKEEEEKNCNKSVSSFNMETSK